MSLVNPPIQCPTRCLHPRCLPAQLHRKDSRLAGNFACRHYDDVAAFPGAPTGESLPEPGRVKLPGQTWTNGMSGVCQWSD